MFFWAFFWCFLALAGAVFVELSVKQSYFQANFAYHLIVFNPFVYRALTRFLPQKYERIFLESVPLTCLAEIFEKPSIFSCTFTVLTFV